MMKMLLKGVFGFAGFVGLFLFMCAASTIDHPGSIPISDWQILTTAIIGLIIVTVAVLGWNSLDRREN